MHPNLEICLLIETVIISNSTGMICTDLNQPQSVLFNIAFTNCNVSYSNWLKHNFIPMSIYSYPAVDILLLTVIDNSA